MVKIYTPFQTQTALKSYPLGPYIAIEPIMVFYSAHIGINIWIKILNTGTVFVDISLLN